VKNNVLMICFVKEQTPEFYLAAVKQDWNALQYIKEQTPEICLEAVKKNGIALRYIKEQTPEICLEAVKQNGISLLYVREQTPEICLEAVKQYGNALQYVREQTPEICLAAVKQDGKALEYVVHQTLEICLAAVKNNGRALEYVEEQTPEICIAAIDTDDGYKYAKYVDPDLYHHIKHLIGKVRSNLINPSEFVSFPEGVSSADFTDPITLDCLKEGEIYGFLVDCQKWYVAGSLKNMNRMIISKFRESSNEYVFVPFKNSLISVEEIKWVCI
jgi:hypothetical protein